MLKVSSKLLAREKLLDQGVALLMQQGYHGTGLQDILGSVGVPKGSFYNYFSSKEDFGAEVIHHYIEPFIQRLGFYLRQPQLSAPDALKAYFQELIDELNRRQFMGGCLLGNLMGEIGDTSPTCRDALRKAVHRYRDKLMEGIRRGQSEGLFRQDKSAEVMADLLADAWQGALLRMKIEQSTRPLEACYRELLDEYFRATQLE